ncbi:MAG: hypothetical protein IT424_11120 [Pirellulales bacterium]|nr:hypothetical protein [Pirellulales bacterium]
MRNWVFILLAACLALLVVEPSQAEPFREITFTPPGVVGDFGNPANWSDPLAAPPQDPPGAPIVDWGNTWYYINAGHTAEINAGSPFGSHFAVWHMFPGDSPQFSPNTPPSFGRLVLNGGPEPAPGEFGASLTVLGANRLILGQRANMGGAAHGFDPSTGDGELIMNGASDLLADGIVVGERDRGYMFIGPDARVRCGRINDSSDLILQDMRIGSFGPSRGETEPIPVLLEGDGLVVVQGSLTANTLYMPESGASGELQLDGGDVVFRRVILNFEPGRASRSSKISINGSSGSFSITAGDLLANHSSVTLSYTADADGVVPIIGQAGADVDSGNLELDLDALQFTPTTKLTLVDVLPDLLFGEFGSVNFLGNTTASLNYDYINGDIYLDNFQRTSQPLAGDFNENNFVTGADLEIWGDGFGLSGSATHTQGDADMDHDVDGRDFLIWQQQFGLAQGVATAAAVPEPGCWLLLALSLSPLAIHGRQRRR